MLLSLVQQGRRPNRTQRIPLLLIILLIVLADCSWYSTATAFLLTSSNPATRCLKTIDMPSSEPADAWLSPSRKRRTMLLQQQIRSNENGLKEEDEDTAVNVMPITAQQQQQYDRANHNWNRQIRREDRIAELVLRQQQVQTQEEDGDDDDNEDAKLPLTLSEEKELNGLLEKFVEPYSSADFTEEHVAFKARHNQVFLQLAQYCRRQRQQKQQAANKSIDNKNNVNKNPSDGSLVSNDDDRDESNRSNASTTTRTTGVGCDTTSSSGNVFYLDGPCAATTKALMGPMGGPEGLYTANRHASTCRALEQKGLIHVVHASATEALQDIYADVCFDAIYLDACGGHVGTILEMLYAAVHRREKVQSSQQKATQSPQQQQSCTAPMALGFSILGGGRDVVDKEQELIQHLVQWVKPLRVEHVADDYAKYGILNSETIRKVESSTLTTWCMIVE